MPTILFGSDQSPVWQSCPTRTVPSKSACPQSSCRTSSVISVYIWTANYQLHCTQLKWPRHVCFYHLCCLCQIRCRIGRSCNLSRSRTDNVNIGLLQLNASWSATGDGCTMATCAECRCSAEFRVGYMQACHGGLLQLHWLPVCWWVQFKLCCLIHSIFYDNCPGYMPTAVVYASNPRQWWPSQCHGYVPSMSLLAGPCGTHCQRTCIPPQIVQSSETAFNALFQLSFQSMLTFVMTPVMHLCSSC